MKTAEEWNWEYTQICANDPAVHGQLLPNPQNINFIKRIQADARHAALTAFDDAYNKAITENPKDVHDAVCVGRKSILALCDKK